MSKTFMSSAVSRLASTALLVALAVDLASAEEGTARAADAFGQRIGVEQIGLYNESQARGFDLTTANAYRIEDAYFVRATALSDTIVDNVAVQVGASAARSSVPAPTGVVNYSLKKADGDRTRVSFGLRENVSPFFEGELRRRSSDGDRGLVADLILQPGLVYADGTRGWNGEAGAIFTSRIGEAGDLTAFASIVDSHSEAMYEFVPTAGTLPPVVHNHGTPGAPYALFANTPWDAGLLVHVRPSEDVRVTASLFSSDEPIRRLDDTLLFIDARGPAQAVLLRTPQNDTHSDSAQLALDWRTGSGPAVQIFGLGVRARRSRIATLGSTAFPLGVVDPEHPSYPGPETPFLPGPERLRDHTREDTLFGSYALLWSDRFEVRAGLATTYLDRRVTDPMGTQTTDQRRESAPSVSLLWAATPELSLFGDWVRGLEDSGSAPQSAVNRNQPLPPVQARQTELGLRWRHPSGVALDFNLFQIEKSVPGFDADNRYLLLPPARHRGAEISLAAGSDEHLSMLLGMTGFHARLDNGLPRQGVVERLAFAQFKLRINAALVLDSVLSFQGSAAVDPGAHLYTEHLQTLDVGARYRFRMGGRTAEARASVINVGDARVWTASAGGTLFRPQPLTFRAVVSLDLDEAGS